MKITGIRFGRLRVPLRTPLKSRARAVHEIDDLIVMIDTDDGRIGYGSAAATPHITGDTHGSILAAIRDHIGPPLIGRPVDDFNQLTELVRSAIHRNPSAKAAVDIALHDLFSQLCGVSLYRRLGGGEPRLLTDYTISVDYIDKMVADAAAAVERGFESLRIAVGKDPVVDVERVKAVHAATEGKAILRLDAGKGWTARQAVQALHELERAGVRIDTIEYPVKGWKLDGMKFVTDRVSTQVVACVGDDGVPGALEVLRQQAADVLTFSLMRCGGITPVAQISDLAATHGVECMMGCMVEGAISTAAAAHLAASRSVITRIDLDGPALGQFQPVDCNVCFADAEISIGDAPGLGITSIQGLEPIPT